MFYTLHVVEPLRYDSVLIKETNEWMNVMGQAQYIFGGSGGLGHKPETKKDEKWCNFRLFETLVP